MGGIFQLLPDGLGLIPALFLIIASFFTSALTASFGVGGGVAMLALMGLFLPVAALIPVHGAVQLGSNTGRAWHQRPFIRHDIFRPFVIGSLIGAVVGAMVVVQLPDALLKGILGLFIIAVTWMTIPGIGSLGRTGLFIGSTLTAVMTMMVGATGLLVASLIGQMVSDDRKGLVATQAAIMTVQHGLKIVVFGFAGFAFASWLPLIAVMIVSGYLGTVFGSRWLERLPEETFRKWFRIGLTLLALDLLRQSIVAYL